MLPGDYPHPYQSSGPPSVHGSVIGSVHGTNLSGKSWYYTGGTRELKGC